MSILSEHASAVIAASAMTVAEVVISTAHRQPQDVCLSVVDGPELTYRELVQRAAIIAANFRSSGVRPGARVAILSSSRVEVIETWIAINMLGAIEVSINPAWTGGMLAHALQSARVSYIVVESSLLRNLDEVFGALDSVAFVWVMPSVFQTAAEAHALNQDMSKHARPFSALNQDIDKASELQSLSPPQAALPADTTSIVYTSGTSGRAKGVLMSHGQVCALAATTALHMRLGKGEVFYCVHPLFHMAGKFMACLATFMSGGRVVLDKRFVADAWLRQIRAFGVTRSLAHGPMIEMVHQTPCEPDDKDNPLEILASAPFPRKIADQFQKRFAVKGIECWGMTEVGVPLWTGVGEVSGSCGRVDRDLYELKIVEPASDREVQTGTAGEMLVRALHPCLLMNGYDGIGAPLSDKGTTEQNWFRTGDIMYADDGGSYYYLDRASDRIRRRAENVSSYEIEAAALQCGAQEAAAVGIDSGFELDDDIKLCVVVSDWDPERLLRELARKLPHYMLPRYIERYESLPRTPTNKVLKSELRRRTMPLFLFDRRAAGISVKTLYAK